MRTHKLSPGRPLFMTTRIRAGSLPVVHCVRRLARAPGSAECPASGRAGDLGRRQHREEIAWECLARVPVLEADDVAVRRVGLAQPGRDLLSNDGGGVVALE